MKYYVATHIKEEQNWAQYYIEHWVHYRDDGSCWTSTRSTDILADATPFSTRKKAEEILDAAYVNPKGDHATKFPPSGVIRVTKKHLFHALLSRGTRTWIGQI